jgi:hypothetical protein
MKRYAVKWLALLVALLLPALSSAADLKILDELGLTRAIKPLSAPTTITVDFQTNRNVDGAKLINESGLAGDISGGRLSQSRFQFSGVSPGTWRIQSIPAGSKVQSVKIE